MQESLRQIMTPDVLPHAVVLLACVALTALAQLLMKVGASIKGVWLARFLNPWTLSGYLLFGAVTVMSVYAMQKIELKFATAMTGMTYVLVMVGAHFLLKERLSLTRIVGSALIIAGIVLFQV